MPESDLTLLIEAARAAGDIARRFFETGAKRWDKPDDAGPVTEADLAVNAMLEAELRAARPGYGWLSEESEDGTERLDRDTVFIVDPIDGTRSFIEGSRAWAHSLAVVHRGAVTAAVIYLPMLDKLYAASVGAGATLNDRAIAVSNSVDLPTSTVLAAKPIYEAQHWISGKAPAFERVHRPSLAYRLSLVAEGRFDAMMTLRPTWEWDIAAGSLILQEAGAVVSDRVAGPLTLNNPVPQVNGVVAGNSVLHSALTGALA